MALGALEASLHWQNCGDTLMKNVTRRGTKKNLERALTTDVSSSWKKCAARTGDTKVTTPSTALHASTGTPFVPTKIIRSIVGCTAIAWNSKQNNLTNQKYLLHNLITFSYIQVYIQRCFINESPCSLLLEGTCTWWQGQSEMDFNRCWHIHFLPMCHHVIIIKNQKNVVLYLYMLDWSK